MNIKGLKTLFLAASFIITSNAYSNQLGSELKNVIFLNSANFEVKKIQETIDSITTESITNPYKIILGPGTFNTNSTIYLPPFISLAGSGVDVTRVQAINSATADVIQLVGDDQGRPASSTLSNMTIVNRSTASQATGVRISGKFSGENPFSSGATLKDLRISFTGQSAKKVGVEIDSDVSGNVNIDSTKISMHSIAISTDVAIGINSLGTLSLNVNNSQIDIFEAQDSYGIVADSNSQTDLRVSNSKIYISTRGTNTGIFVFDIEGTNTIIDNNQINVRSGTDNIGLDIYTQATFGGRATVSNNTIDTELSSNQVSQNNIGLNARSFSGSTSPLTKIIVKSSSITGSIPPSTALKCFSSNDLVNNLDINCQPL